MGEKKNKKLCENDEEKNVKFCEKFGQKYDEEKNVKFCEKYFENDEEKNEKFCENDEEKGEKYGSNELNHFIHPFENIEARQDFINNVNEKKNKKLSLSENDIALKEKN